MFWLSNILFDVACFMVTIILTFILFAAFGQSIITGAHFGPALLLFVLCTPQLFVRAARR